METLHTLESTLRNAIGFFQDQAKKVEHAKTNPTLGFVASPVSTLNHIMWQKAADELQMRYVSLIGRVVAENKLGTVPSLDIILATANAGEVVPSVVTSTKKVVGPVAAEVVATVVTTHVETAPETVEQLAQEIADLKKPITVTTTLKAVLAADDSVKAVAIKDSVAQGLSALLESKNEEAIIALYDKHMGAGAYAGNKYARREIKEVVADFNRAKRAAAEEATILKIEKLISEGKVTTTSGIQKDISGKDLISNAHKYTIDGIFNVLVLTGVEESAVDAGDLINLQAKQLLASGQEGIAVQFIQTKYAELGFDTEMSRVFLHKLVREDKFSELRNAVKGILLYGETAKEDYRTMLSHANDIVRLHSRKPSEDPADNGYKTWANNKVLNFVNACVDELITDGYLSDNHMDVVKNTSPETTTVVETAVVTAESDFKEQIDEVTEEIKAVVEEVAAVNKKQANIKKHAQTKAEKKAAKKASKEVALVTAPIEDAVIVEEQPAKEVILPSLVSTLAATSGPSLEDVNNELKTSYEQNGCITRTMQLYLANHMPVWQNPLYPKAIVLDKEGNQTKESVKEQKSFYTRIAYTLKAADIDPLDFQMIRGTDGSDNARVRIVNNVQHTLDPENNWISPSGVKIVEAVIEPIVLPETVTAAPEEVAEPKKVEASATEAVASDAGQSVQSEDTEKSLQTSSSEGTHKVLDVVEGVPVIEMAVTTAAKAKPTMYAYIEKTAKGFKAYLKDFKMISINNAATEEEAQVKLAEATSTYINAAEEHNAAVNNGKIGKKMNLPKWLTHLSEIEFFLATPKQTAAAAV